MSGPAPSPSPAPAAVPAAPAVPPPSGRARVVLAGVAILFLAAVAGAWGWFHLSPREFPTALSFHPRATVPGLEFKALPVGDVAVDILATTNFLNGEFRSGPPARERYTVFLANWTGTDARQMSVVQHTPDICWVGVGWTPVQGEAPSKLEIEFAGTRLPFECRIFRPPGGGALEMTLWCTLVSGQVFEEGARFAAENDQDPDHRKRFYAAGRRVALQQFTRVLQDRVPGDGRKQFVRFSTRLDGDWKPVAERLQAFARNWLELQVTRNTAAAPADARTADTR